ncbi:cation transporter [Niallia sp.]|uniref:heavy-metal-associated domain-containing protein n=1 Tax=Niallia sp. TaxID=2837523 RepID=UPI002897A73E|nr:cation transporter [Niallia sp.]
MRVQQVLAIILFLFLLFLSACSNEKEIQTITSNNSNSVSFTVTDMYCASCPFVVESAINKVDGVNNVIIETKGTEGTVTVSYDDVKTDIKIIQESVLDLGYGVK